MAAQISEQGSWHVISSVLQQTHTTDDGEVIKDTIQAQSGVESFLLQEKDKFSTSFYR